MKNMRYKNQEPRVIKFDMMVGDGGFTLDYNPSAKRFDLKQDGDLEYSHMDSVACMNIARSRFDVEMVVPKKENKDEKN